MENSMKLSKPALSSENIEIVSLILISFISIWGFFFILHILPVPQNVTWWVIPFILTMVCVYVAITVVTYFKIVKMLTKLIGIKITSEVAK
jgi:hypothetical protein